MNHVYRDLIFGVILYCVLRGIGCSDATLQGIIAALLLAAKITEANIKR
jgi:hypothetical protein